MVELGKQRKGRWGREGEGRREGGEDTSVRVKDLGVHEQPARAREEEDACRHIGVVTRTAYYQQCQLRRTIQTPSVGFHKCSPAGFDNCIFSFDF